MIRALPPFRSLATSAATSAFAEIASSLSVFSAYLDIGIFHPIASVLSFTARERRLTRRAVNTSGDLRATSRDIFKKDGRSERI
jgi:hypothetical protein